MASPSSKRPRLEAEANTDPPRIRLKGPSSDRFRSNMVKLWREGSLCDVEVSVEGEVFRAHRNVLAAGSDFMSALFCGDRFKDSSEGSIEIGDVSAASFKLILEWLYEGQCDVEESELMLLLEAASRLQCVDLLSKLEGPIAGRLDVDTCLDAWDVADRMQLSELAVAAEAKALECYKDLVSTEEFKSLPAAKLSRLISSVKLKMKNEEAVFESILSWVKAQSTQPSDEELGAIFDHVRFSLMSEEFINDTVETEKVVTENTRVVMALYRSMNNLYRSAHGLSNRLCYPLIWSEIKIGMRVRVKDDREFLQAIVARTERLVWFRRREDHIGAQLNVTEVDESKKTVFLSCDQLVEVLWPFEALERG